LPFADGSFDAVTIAFGNRNVASLERLYAEMARVLRPGGRAASLEITPPDAPLMRALFFLYFGHAPALMARLLGSDPGAYRYLPDSVRTYPNAEAVVDLMRAAGLHEVRHERHLGGAITLHVGVR
jgi:demethylmenaquinone methyltransferase/2-methoxy-6-polyprenyl-1,4-benzoquinol methylase